MTTYKAHLNEFFAEGKDQTEKHWNAIIRQMLVRGLLRKEIETYGTLKITELGQAFKKSPESFMVVKEEEIGETDDDDQLLIPRQAGGGAADEALFVLLKELRAKVSKEKKLPPYVIFQDPALEEMATQYPITMDELASVSGVGKGKAVKFGAPFLKMIDQYVKDNEIERPEDFVVKSAVNKSGQKVQIIQNIDKKIPLPDIARGLGKTQRELLDELESIIASGTKINIQYWIKEELDDDQQQDIFDYFMGSETEDIRDAEKHFDGEFEEDQLRLMRIKFMSEVGF